MSNGNESYATINATNNGFIFFFGSSSSSSALQPSGPQPNKQSLRIYFHLFFSTTCSLVYCLNFFQTKWKRKKKQTKIMKTPIFTMKCDGHAKQFTCLTIVIVCLRSFFISRFPNLLLVSSLLGTVHDSGWKTDKQDKLRILFACVRCAICRPVDWKPIYDYSIRQWEMANKLPKLNNEKA